MSSGLTHTGAIARGLGYVPTTADARPAVRAEAAPDVARVSAVKPILPSDNDAETREQIREQVMAERGVDSLSLYRASSQDRIRAETAIMVETAMRSLASANQARAYVRPTANFVDLRV
jgi:hypothetical protein